MTLCSTTPNQELVTVFSFFPLGLRVPCRYSSEPKPCSGQRMYTTIETWIIQAEQHFKSAWSSSELVGTINNLFYLLYFCISIEFCLNRS